MLSSCVRAKKCLVEGACSSRGLKTKHQYNRKDSEWPEKRGMGKRWQQTPMSLLHHALLLRVRDGARPLQHHILEEGWVCGVHCEVLRSAKEKTKPKGKCWFREEQTLPVRVFYKATPDPATWRHQKPPWLSMGTVSAASGTSQQGHVTWLKCNRRELGAKAKVSGYKK